jgi:NRAMP (natural resistance-associated macrophage protein)-like metal ion transporter
MTIPAASPLIWTLLLTTPLMIGIQMLSARIGWVTGEGLAANIRQMFPRWLTTILVSLLVVANTINIAADIGAMGEAARLLMGGKLPVYVLGFGVLCVATQVFFSYERTVRILKWLTLGLFAYVAVILTVNVPWHRAITQSLQPWAFLPKDSSAKDYAAMVVAVLGTTISPYLFFWQAAQEVEDNDRRPEAKALRTHPEYAAEHLSRIKQDTFIGMTFSNVIAICIVIATAVTLHEQGITNIQTSAQAAEALRPVAGEFAFAVFALGIVGTGLLAVPVLAGSAAYAVSELYGWKAGLSRGFHEARGFYLIIMAATGMGTLMGYFEVDPIKALVWSAIVNGVISVPIMAALMWIGQSERRMGQYTISKRHRFFGWSATAVMAVAVVLMFATSF